MLIARSSIIIALYALGIGAASFASWSGIGFGDGNGSLSLSKCRGLILRDGNEASKDIAESPTALPERPK